MTAATLTLAGQLGTALSRISDQLDRRYAIYQALDQIAGAADDETLPMLLNAIADVQGAMISEAEDILEDHRNDDRYIDMYLNGSEGFRAAVEWRRNQTNQRRAA